MKKQLIYLSLAAVLMTSCTKENDTSITAPVKASETIPVNEFVKYTINKGEQYCDKSNYAAVTYEELKFIVKFDSSAVYKTIATSNQNDINKLFGFSDNNKQHHEFSARFGWRWYQNALHLMAYVYNNSIMSFKEIGVVQIGAENNCSIKVAGESYIFTLNGTTVTMPRASTTIKAEGYKLYPYFGGDEMAPHTISILIKETVN
ncbi:MAG TPA: hypothetical protein VF623_08790 [Segetibacter sp.]|jgi:hypothetical protein